MLSACVVGLITLHYYWDNSLTYVNPCMVTDLEAIAPDKSYHEAKCKIGFPGRYNSVQVKETCEVVAAEMRKFKP